MSTFKIVPGCGFIKDYPDYDVDVLLCAFTDKEYKACMSEVKPDAE